jgi:kinetochore protein Mis13/DSN1
MIHQNTYAATHFSAQVTRFLDGIFAAFTQDLRNQDQIELGTSQGLGATDSKTPANVFASTSVAAPSKPRRDPMDLLRALAAAEATHQSEETLSAASALPIVPSAISMRAGSNVGNLASVLMTPRRQAVMTPRRAPAMGTTPRRLPMLSSAAKGASTTSMSPSRRN